MSTDRDMRVEPVDFQRLNARRGDAPADAPASADTPTHLWSRWIYLRVLAFLYAVSFFSLSSQIVGLIGPDGIFPARDILSTAAHRAPGFGRFFAAPSLAWLSAEP